MPLTVFVDSHDVVPHSARGYTFFRNVDGQLRRTDTLGNVFEEFPPFIRASSGMSSTAEELVVMLGLGPIHGRMCPNLSPVVVPVDPAQ